LQPPPFSSGHGVPGITPVWFVPPGVQDVQCSSLSGCSVFHDDLNQGTPNSNQNTWTQFNFVTEASDPAQPLDSSFNTALVESHRERATLQLTGSGSAVTGTVLNESSQPIATIDGIAVSNGFFLLRIVALFSDNNGTCPPVHMQAFASIRSDNPNGLNFSGSGGTGGPECPPHHSFLSGGFSRQTQ
jgi:hypothetical protein